MLWENVGTWLQLIGGAIVVYGLLDLRAEIDPDSSWLVKFRRRRASTSVTLRSVFRSLARWLDQLWHRLRGRKVSEGQISSTLPAPTGKLIGKVIKRRPWEELILEERVRRNHEDVQGLRKDATRLRRQIGQEKHAREADIEKLRQWVDDLSIGGLTREAVGLALIAAGVVLQAWPWVPSTRWGGALLLVAPVGAVGWWLVNPERSWWQP